jgi:hypothetical protein
MDDAPSRDWLAQCWSSAAEIRADLAEAPGGPEKAAEEARLAGAIARLVALDRGPQRWEAVVTRLADGLGPTQQNLEAAFGGGTPGRVRDGRSFYAERLAGQSSLVPALNAAIGGRVVSREAFAEVATAFLAGLASGSADRLPEEQRRRADPTLGTDAELLAAFLGYLHAQDMLDGPARLTVRHAALEEQWRPLLAGIEGDRTILSLTDKHGGSGHLVAFRRDEQDAWWLIDSSGIDWGQSLDQLQGAAGPRREQIAPAAYVARLVARQGEPKLGLIELITMGAPKEPAVIAHGLLGVGVRV